jgi:signal transduction histidine kinase
MNRLWVRLSFYFSLLIFCGMLMFALLPRFLLNRNVSDAIAQTQDGLVAQLAQFYTESGKWTGVSDLLRPYDIGLPRGFGAQPTALVFADANGSLLYDGTGQREGAALTAAERAAAIPITVSGSQRGYLMLQLIDFTPPSGSDPNFMLRNLLNSLFVFALIIGGMGIIAGIVVSRQLTAPLSELAETVRTFRQPILSKRAPVKGTIEVREVATAFNQMADTLAEAERLRRNLVGDVAHELRTPLTVLQANIQALLDDLYPLNKTEIQNLQAQTDLLQRLVDDLHQLAQAEAGQLRLNMMSVNLNGLVQSLVEHFNAITQIKGLTLSAKVPAAPILTAVDPNRIAQVLQNLIQNAISHTPEGGTITVALSNDVDNICISVIDTGAGISSEDQKRIFERFYRADEARSRATGGAGLGLPIAKAIIEMHQGTISVYSDGITDHGTTFTITLPNAQTILN